MNGTASVQLAIKFYKVFIILYTADKQLRKVRNSSVCEEIYKEHACMHDADCTVAIIIILPCSRS